MTCWIASFTAILEGKPALSPYALKTVWLLGGDLAGEHGSLSPLIIDQVLIYSVVAT